MQQPEVSLVTQAKSSGNINAAEPEDPIVAQPRSCRPCTRRKLLACIVLVVGCIALAVAGCFAFGSFGPKSVDPEGPPEDPQLPVDDFIEVLIQRHGESMNNRGCKVIDTQLTEKGVKQAEETHEFLVSEPSLTPNISFSSALTRAMQTAAISFGRKVYIADFIPEYGWGAAPACTYGTESCAVTPEQQINFMKKGRYDVCKVVGPSTPSVVRRLDWSYLGGKPKDYSANHEFDWNRFLEWLWDHDEVKNLVAQKRAGSAALMSVTTHGAAMKHYLFHGTNLKHPKNTAIYKAKFPLQVKNGTVLGFEKRRPVDLECLWRCPPLATGFLHVV